MAISNEVLAERIEGYTRQTIAESQQVRRDLSAAIEEMGRVKDAITIVGEKLVLHEQLDGHPVGALKVGLLEKDSAEFRRSITQLRDLVTLKDDVAGLKVIVTEIKNKQDSQDSFEKGRRSALSAGEKAILLILAAVGPTILLIERLG